jgi:hypothetical protein
MPDVSQANLHLTRSDEQAGNTLPRARYLHYHRHIQGCIGHEPTGGLDDNGASDYQHLHLLTTPQEWSLCRQ